MCHQVSYSERKKNRDEIRFLCQLVLIKPKKSIVYLGITMGQCGLYGEHTKKSTLKAEEKAAQLMRITGPDFTKKLMLYNVVQSILLHEAPI